MSDSKSPKLYWYYPKENIWRDIDGDGALKVAPNEEKCWACRWAKVCDSDTQMFKGLGKGYVINFCSECMLFADVAIDYRIGDGACERAGKFQQ